MIVRRLSCARLRLGWIALSAQAIVLTGGALGSLLTPREAAAVIRIQVCPDGSIFPGWGDGPKPGGGVTVTAGCQNTYAYWDEDGGGGRSHTGGGEPGGGGGHGQTHIPNNTAPSNKVKNNKSGCADPKGDPILVSSGTKVETYPVFALPGEMGLSFTLYYNTAFKIPHALSNTFWSTNLGYTLTDSKCIPNKNDPDELICRAKTYQRPDGSTLTFDIQGGSFVEVGGGGLATLTGDATSPYILHDEDGTTKTFDDLGNIKSITNASGISWTITTSAPPAGFTYTVTHSSGKSYSITYGSANTVTVTDPLSNVYTLQRTSDGNYTSITYPGLPSTTLAFKYALSALPNLLTEVDYNGVPYNYTSYDTASTSPYYRWATGSRLADDTESTAISYTRSAAGNLQATITNALGHRSTQTYDGTNGPGGAYNGQLSQISDDAVADCGATIKSRSYDVNGNLSKVVDNNGNVHTYAYAATGQLQSETEAYGTTEARTTSYTWDANLQLNRLASVTVEGWSKTVYTYNPQNRLASVAVTNLSGNGSASQTLTTTYGYTLYANGMVHIMTVTRPSPSNSDTDTYTYDTLGNLVSVANGLGQTTTYSNYNGLGQVGHVVGSNGGVTDYTYDPRGRIATKTTHPNGGTATWTYGYDGFGELASLAAPDGETTTWNRNVVMRVTSIVRNDKDGASTEGFGYNANGDVTSHTVSRGGVTSLSETLVYDALGRIYKRQGNHGQLLTYGYDGNGNVLSVVDAAGHTVSNEYDALNRVKRTTSSGGASPPMPSTAPTLSAPANSGNGSYSVSWNSVSGANSYILQEQANGGVWAIVQNGAATNWATSGKSNGGYGYRVRACNGSGCGPWSMVSAVTVAIVPPPSTAPSMIVPSTSSTGSYVVDWTGVAGRTYYNLQISINGGIWTQLYESHGEVWNASNQGDGTYGYRAQACNDNGCGPWSATGTVTVLHPPSTAPSMIVPSTSSTGSYVVDWTGVAGRTYYNLQISINGGIWTQLYVSHGEVWNASGQSNGSYGYRAQACNTSGCGPWSNTGTVTVLLIPATPAGLSATLYAEWFSDTRPPKMVYSLTASWPSVAGATSYGFKYCQQSGSCYTTTTAATSVPEFYVQGATTSVAVQACNASGCSAMSTAVTPTTVNR